MFQQRIQPEGGTRGVALRPERTLLAALLAEIADASSEEQAAGFFGAVGARIAALMSLDGIEDADELTARINGLWDALGWGQVALDFDDNGIDIHHRDLPALLADDRAPLWHRAAPAVLAGAYHAWFRALGSGVHLSTRVLRVSPQQIALRHGY